MDFEHASFTDLGDSGLYEETEGGFSFAPVQSEAHGTQNNPFIAASQPTFKATTKLQERSSYPNFVQQPPARPLDRANQDLRRKDSETRSSKLQGLKDTLNRGRPIPGLETRLSNIEAR